LKIGSVRKKMVRRNILAIVMLSVTFSFIIWVGIHYNFEMITTRIGIIITLVSIIIGIVFNSKLANLLIKQNDPTLSNNDYLQKFIEFRNQQKLIQTKGISFYFVFLTIGIMLYMLEFAKRDVTFGIMVYGITLAWIAFNWFYLRKKTIDKQEKEINEQIALLEGLVNQFKQEL
jgi:hypothetical protein